MNRPCLSLGVLLASLAVCLLAVGSANSQTGLDVYSPPCLMCPYAETAFSHEDHPFVAQPTPQPTATSPSDAVAAEAEAVEVIGADYDLDYVADSTDYESTDADVADESDTDYSDYDYSDYDYSDYDYSDYESGSGENPDDAETAATDETEYDDSEYGDSLYDYSDYENEYDSSNYDSDVDANSEYDADRNTDISDEADTEYDDSEYDYSEYDYSDYDTEYDSTSYDSDDANSEYDAEGNTVISAEADTEYEYSEYEYSEYDYSDYDYSDYDNDDTVTDAEATTESDAVVDTSDVDPSDDTDAGYDYSDYEGFYDAETTEATPAPVGVIPSHETTPDATEVSSETDNYDYEDYFAEVYGTAEAAPDVESGDQADTESSVISNEDVDAFDFFDGDAYGPTGPQQDPSIDATDGYDNYDGYPTDDELIEMNEEALADDDTTPVSDPAARDADVASDADVSGTNEDSANSLYDLRTTYDASYDEAMAPAPRTENHGYGDHCFGGYLPPYHSDYRCDLADQYTGDAYQSFYHDGSDPSAVSIDSDSVENDSESNTSVMLELRTMVDPYVAIAMERVASAWQLISLDAIISKAAREIAKLPRVLVSGEEATREKTAISDYIDCHIDTPYEGVNSCESDIFTPWETPTAVGSGLKKSADAAIDLDATPADANEMAKLNAAKVSFRDLRSRMNAVRQSPPLR